MTHAPLGSLAVVGSINVDLTALVERIPSPGETVLGGTLSRQAGGKGANQAAAAARLGGRVRMIGAVGDDADGQWMRQSLADAGVDARGVKVRPGATGTALITVDAQGENQIVVCAGANNDVTLKQNADADIAATGIAATGSAATGTAATGSAATGSALFAPDEAVLAQLEIPLETVLALIDAVPGYLAVNAAPARPLPPELIERADLIIVNETEYALMPECAGARLVAVTYGADGAALVVKGEQVARVASPRVTAISSVGAGDAFCAAITLALHAGWSHHDALTAACAVGAASVTSASAQPPLDALASYLAD